MSQDAVEVDVPEDPKPFVSNSDINFAAALRAQYAIETPKAPRRRHKKPLPDEIEEPLVDETKAIPLHSKKTERLQKRQQKKSQKASLQASNLSLSEFPTEILVEIFSWLRVEDVFRMSRTSRSMRDLVLSHEKPIAKGIVSRRYWILYRCLEVPPSTNSFQ